VPSRCTSLSRSCLPRFSTAPLWAATLTHLPIQVEVVSRHSKYRTIKMLAMSRPSMLKLSRTSNECGRAGRQTRCKRQIASEELRNISRCLVDHSNKWAHSTKMGCQMVTLGVATGHAVRALKAFSHLYPCKVVAVASQQMSTRCHPRTMTTGLKP